jgi:hypothetical protein
MWSQRVNLCSREGASMPSGEFLAGYTTGSFRVPEPVRFCIAFIGTRLRRYWCSCIGNGSDSVGDWGGRGRRSAFAEGIADLELAGGGSSDGLSDGPMVGLTVELTGCLA